MRASRTLTWARPRRGVRPTIGRAGLIALGLALLVGGGSPAAWAQWTTQTIPLDPGWNVVFLEVRPEPSDCAALFAGLPVESVWRWSRRPGRLQFTLDPNQLLPRDPDWLFWLPPTHPQASLNTLFALHAGDACLIKLPAQARPVTWQLKGVPAVFRRQWLAGALNLTGLPVPASATTFEDFFRDATAIRIARSEGGEVYQLDANGLSTRLWEPSRARIRRGAAYWILSRSATDYAGPLRVRLDRGELLEFPTPIWTRRLSIHNDGAAARTVTVRPLPSEAPPPGDFFPVAGPVPLDYREKDWSGGFPREVYRSVAPQVSRTLAPGATWTIELSPRRGEMTGAAPGALWQSLLEVTDGATVRQLVGVRAE